MKRKHGWMVTLTDLNPAGQLIQTKTLRGTCPRAMLCTEKEKVYPLTVCICKCLNLETYIFMNRTECATASVQNNIFVQEIKPPVITTLQQKLSLKTLDNSGQYGPYLSALFGSHTTTSIRKCLPSIPFPSQKSVNHQQQKHYRHLTKILQ